MSKQASKTKSKKKVQGQSNEVLTPTTNDELSQITQINEEEQQSESQEYPTKNFIDHNRDPSIFSTIAPQARELRYSSVHNTTLENIETFSSSECFSEDLKQYLHQIILDIRREWEETEYEHF